jgi:bacterioferritin (cytochrome b1)
MTKEEALKGLAYLGAVWFGNSKQHFAFSAYDRLNGWNKLADKWKEEAEEEWDEAEEVLNRLVELGCKKHLSLYSLFLKPEGRSLIP